MEENKAKEELESMDKKDVDVIKKENKEFSAALSDTDLEKFCKKNNLKCGMIEIEELSKLDPKQQFYFLFTGEKKEADNGGNPKHWLLIDKNKIFDSYGKRDYNLPAYFKYLNKKQFQQYGSVVCGEYCLAALNFLTHNSNITESNFSTLFSEEYGFGPDKEENDEIVKLWYTQHK
jgi:hypothetical protein